MTSKTYAPLSYLSYLSVIAVLVLGWFLDKKQFALAFFINAVLAAMWMYLGFRGRIVERVCYGMFLLQFLSMLAVGWRILLGAFSRKREGSRQLSAGIMLVCAVLLILPARKEWQEVEENVGWRSSYNEEFLDVNRYMAEHMENVYFMTTFSIETYTDNFTLRRDFAFTNLLSVGGWHTFSPLENEKCQKLGITDPKTDIVEKENVYVISLENVNLRYMDRYYTSVYGEEYLGRELTDALDYGERVFEVYDFSVRENESNRSE